MIWGLPLWIALLLFFPYFFLIHFGQFVFLLTLFKKIIRKSFSVKVTVLKIVFSIYGTVGGLLILITNEIYDDSIAVGPFWGDLPALGLGAWIEDNVYRGASDQYFLRWQFILPYVILGFIGGWGLGQLFEATLKWIRKGRLPRA